MGTRLAHVYADGIAFDLEFGLKIRAGDGTPTRIAQRGLHGLKGNGYLALEGGAGTKSKTRSNTRRGSEQMKLLKSEFVLAVAWRWKDTPNQFQLLQTELPCMLQSSDRATGRVPYEHYETQFTLLVADRVLSACTMSGELVESDRGGVNSVCNRIRRFYSLDMISWEDAGCFAHDANSSVKKSASVMFRHVYSGNVAMALTSRPGGATANLRR